MIRLRFTLWLFAISLLASACQTAQPGISNASTVEFTILQLNDVYEISPLEGGKAGGLARVGTVKQELLAENPNTIAVIAGDFLSPSLIGTLKQEDGERIAGLQMVEVLNTLGMDYATFGNHEFDLSDPDLLQKRIHQSTFEYTVCNAFRADGGQVRPFRQIVGGQDRPIPEYIIREFRNPQGQAVRVGIIGVVLPFNRQPYVHYEDVVEAFRAAYEAVEPQADLVIALTHLAVADDIALAREVPGVLLFIGGHDHTNMSHYAEHTIIAKADANAKTAYIHRVAYNPASGFARVRSSLKKIDDSIADHPATREVVDKWQGKVDQIMKSMGYVPGEQVYYAHEPLECKETDVRSRPTNYGHLTVASFDAAWPGADVYLVNSGSMRMDDDILGTVTQYDVLRTFPFGGPIARLELPGNVLEKALEIGLLTNRGEGGYFQIKDVENINGKWHVKGNPIDIGRQYKVVLPEFVASGKEANLGFLKDFKYEKAETLTIQGKPVRNDVRDLVIAYLKSL
jgi:2',3'-cyclic-nucleotide 2'-phosphodiesterase (5'-nucleotidase family)